MRAVIGILPVVDGDGVSSVRPEYVRAVEEAGGVALMLPYTESAETVRRFCEICDGFIFAGGVDIEPERYGEPRRECCGETSPLRDRVELLAFAEIFNTGKPILGICRGCQLINVALGGTLYQDLVSERGGDVVHRSAVAGETAHHDVTLDGDSHLAVALGCERVSVNSIHHQAIKKRGRGLSPFAIADDGLIEAARHDTHPYLEIYQWHPERIRDGELGRAIFAAFVAATEKA